MIFKESDLSAVDFTTLKEGSVANATLKSFSYRSGYCFATIVADKESIQAIVGKQEDLPLPMMLQLKGIEVEVKYLGTKASNGVTYPRYSIEF